MTTTPMPPPLYLLGLDLGQAHDYSAWITAERTTRGDDGALYDVRHSDRIRGARYPAIVEHTTALVAALREPLPVAPPATSQERVQQHHDRRRAARGLPPVVAPLRPTVHLVVDYTGVGRPVADMLLAADLDCTLTLVTITGGDAVTRGETGELRVPKRDLASCVQVLLQSERLRIGDAVPHATTLTDELVNFKVTISLTGHDSYGAGADWRAGNHDDLVLSLALACWYGEKRLPSRAVAAAGIPQRSAWGEPLRPIAERWRSEGVAMDS